MDVFADNQLFKFLRTIIHHGNAVPVSIVLAQPAQVENKQVQHPRENHETYTNESARVQTQQKSEHA
jgi:hypothetical protein